MAESEVTVHIRLQDFERFRLFMWELNQLLDDMRVMASPHVERLEKLLERVDLSEEGDR